MNKKSNTNSEIVEIKLQGHTAGILKQAVEFLKIFLPKTLAKRLFAIILGDCRHGLRKIPYQNVQDIRRQASKKTVLNG